MVDINDFMVQVDCTYKGELYSVRDNGAILRHKRSDKKKRPHDERWTFSTTLHNGYAMFCGEGVHRIVATAFHGEAPSQHHVVDHYDTNRQNNRPENLRWLTKLENILNNPYTREKVIRICGSIEEFLKNPNLLYGYEIDDSNFSWMRAVSIEEAKNTLARMDCWLSKPYKEQSKLDGHLGEWLFTKQEEKYNNGLNKPADTPLNVSSHNEKQKINYAREWDELRRAMLKPNEINQYNNNLYDEKHMIMESLTVNALQDYSKWKTPTEFPLCPNSGCNLETYFRRLTKGEIVTINNYIKTCVHEAALVNDKESPFISVICKNISEVCIKEWCLIRIYVHNNMYVHESNGTFFHEDGVQKYHTLAQGKDWIGGDVFDDFC